MSIWWTIEELVMCALETGLLYFVCFRLLEINPQRNRWERILAFIGATGISYILTLVSDYSVGKILAGLVIDFIYIFYLTSGAVWKRGLYTGLSFVLLGIWDMICIGSLVMVTHLTFEHIATEPIPEKLLSALLSKMMFFVTVLIFSLKRNQGKDPLPPRYMIGLIILLVSLVGGVFLIGEAWIFNQAEIKLEFMLIFFLTVFLLGAMAFYFLLFQLALGLQKEKELELYRYKEELTQKYLKEKEASYQLMRKQRHDLKQQVTYWTYLANEGELRQLKEEFYQYGVHLDQKALFSTGNLVADAMINDRSAVAAEYGITMTASGNFYGNMKLSSLEICSLLGNLLDNAIEAVKDLEHSRRWLDLRLRSDGCYLHLDMVNPCGEVSRGKEGLFFTTKKDKANHGIGLSSIRAIAENHEGYAEFSVSCNKFISAISLIAYDIKDDKKR